MRVPEVSSEEARRLLADAVGGRVDSIERQSVGHGSSNWRGRVGDDLLLLKVGPASSADKWASAEVARQRAAEAGVPVPTLRSSRRLPVGVVRVFDWVEAMPLAAGATDSTARSRSADELGRAVALLHTLDRDRFSSRLDGSAPTFPTWRDYVSARMAAIRRRAESVDALAPALLDRVSSLVAALAASVSSVVTPVICHRDLHPDNVLVGADGRLAAVLDWDMSEAWDPAGDRFKLDWRLLPALGDAAPRFEVAYAAVHPPRPSWPERVRLVALLEGANSVANAVLLGAQAYAAEARTLLLAAVEDDPVDLTRPDR